jgi:hypothetical protein
MCLLRFASLTTSYGGCRATSPRDALCFVSYVSLNRHYLPQPWDPNGIPVPNSRLPDRFFSVRHVVKNLPGLDHFPTSL